MRRGCMISAWLAALVATGCGSSIETVSDTDQDTRNDTAGDASGDTPGDPATDTVLDGVEDPGTDASPPDAAPEPEPDTPGGGLVGDPCVDETELTDCSGIPSSERFCLDEMRMGPAGTIEFPGGYCSAPCRVDGDCGERGLCIPVGWEDAYCFRECADERDCREGYVCDTLPGPGTTPETFCLPPMW